MQAMFSVLDLKLKPTYGHVESMNVYEPLPLHERSCALNAHEVLQYDHMSHLRACSVLTYVCLICVWL